MSPPSSHLFLNILSSSLIIRPFRQLIWVQWPRASLDHTVPHWSESVNWSWISAPNMKHLINTHLCLFYPPAPPCLHLFVPLNPLVSLALSSDRIKDHHSEAAAQMYAKSMAGARWTKLCPRWCKLKQEGISSKWNLREKCSQRCISFEQQANEILPCSIYSREKCPLGISG